MMKNLLFAIIAMVVCSCKEDFLDPIGLWDSIELSQSEVSFSAEGGTATVVCLNYNLWWLNGIRACGSGTYYPAIPGKDFSYDYASGDGIIAEVNSNCVVVTVEPSTDKREWVIDMESGDVFTSIHVKQN